VIGGRQIRNIATVGGNTVNASPGVDPCRCWLDARSNCADRAAAAPSRSTGSGERGRTDRRPDEILTAVRFAKPPDASATWFLKAGRRKAMEISVICVAVHLVQNGKARIAIGAAASRTVRVPEAEALVERGRRGFGGRVLAADRTRDRRRPRLGTLPQAPGRYLVERALTACADRTGKLAHDQVGARSHRQRREPRALITVPVAAALRGQIGMRHQGELPRSRMRRLHRAAGRQGGEFVHLAGGAVPWPLDRYHRGWAIPSICILCRRPSSSTAPCSAATVFLA
jgi:hypothetical protein